jgi:2-haloacid dehalogenase
MTNGARDTVVFDLGGVLIDWDPRHLYRKLFAGDEAELSPNFGDGLKDQAA